MQSQSQKTFVSNLTKDGIYFLEETTQSEIYLQITNSEEIKNERQKNGSHKYFK